jgi:hypothetical protein
MQITLVNKAHALSMKKKAVFDRPYVPKLHPMQHRIDAFRAVPSLVTGG